MRKALHQQIIEFIDSMRKAHQEIERVYKSKDIVLTQNMMADLQDMAIAFGELIEKSEGEGFVTVSYVEEYCEVIFATFQAIKEGTIDSLRVQKNLDTALKKIEKSVRNDIVIKKEAVFFPYNVTMWDCLESVYKKLKADPTYDVYCVPIPYFDLNPDESTKEIHYDGARYPEDVEVMDFRKYDLEARRPDEIYIHNPYDDINLVTRVPDMYFSRNLRKYTEKLVYIPYFVLPEIDPEDQNAVDSIKHLVITPAAMNAHKVIVQSEAIRQIYINEIMKYAMLHDQHNELVDRAAMERRIDGSGSPKFERLNNTSKSDIEIPDEWQKIIQKSDGSRKKIVFYNTTLSTFLDTDGDYLAKIEDVLKMFYKNRGDIALLWRPHPLMQSTIESMKENMSKRYKQLVDEYKQGGWGIYDDTADLDRAIVLSDAYYGDNSSVLVLYKTTGKPIMVQNVNVINGEE